MNLKQIIRETVQTNWRNILDSSITPDVQRRLDEDVKQNKTIFPKNDFIFRAFSKFDIQDTKVVIIGQDPYASIDKITEIPFACGLAFAIRSGQKMAPSFRNICNEIYRCYQEKRSNNPELEDLVDQGVLLLNRSLTVVKDRPNSHARIWKNVTNKIIQDLSEKTSNVVFLLWGNNAQELEEFINQDKHLVLKWSHPSPLSRKLFIGNNHFVLANEYLENHGKKTIKWA